MVVLSSFKRAKKQARRFDNPTPQLNEKACYLLKQMESDPPAFRKWLDKADALNQSFATREAEIRFLNREIAIHPVDGYIQNIDQVDILGIRRLIKRFSAYTHIPNSPSANYLKELIQFESEYEPRLAQFELRNRLLSNREIIASRTDYINHSSVLSMIESDDHDRSTLNDYHTLYYDFSAFRPLADVIKEHNEAYIQKHLHDKIFDDISGRSLDAAQREAVLTDEDSTLVIAAAGSGKTLTIAGKVAYLLKANHLDPSKLLFLSYSKKSATDLDSRLKKVDLRLSASTFHALGLKIINDIEGMTPPVEDQFEAILLDYFRSDIRKDKQALRDFILYYALYLGEDEDKRYRNIGELYAELKLNRVVTLKDEVEYFTAEGGEKKTIKGERVKSVQEAQIANFYFLNGIDYEYERPYEKKTLGNKRQYQPDFYLPDYHLYHEHYGIDKHGRCRFLTGEEASRYEEGIRFKRGLHAHNHTACLETYSYQFGEENVFEHLRKQLEGHGVKLKPLDDQRLSAVFEVLLHDRRLASFIKTIQSFISLYKARYEDEKGFDNLFPSLKRPMKERLFIAIAKRAYRYYMDRIREEGKIDFDDMINRSMRLLPESSSFQYTHIVVDEFQDISYSRMRFLQALIKHGHSRLYAVGDDYQSIYRFAGSDLSFFYGFDQYFGYSARKVINKTYRNGAELQRIASNFVMANPAQFKKEVISDKHLENPIMVIYSYEDKKAAFDRAMTDITLFDPDPHVLLLVRNNADFTPYEPLFHNAKGRLVADDYPSASFSLSTVHGSKGLEEDYVIVLACDSRINGFPNLMEDDPVLSLLLGEKEPFPLAEERRLFYVALTRTRHCVYLIADGNRPSGFIKELGNQVVELNHRPTEPVTYGLCPDCGSGKLRLTENKKGQPMLYCSNYPYCDYHINHLEKVHFDKRCPLCGDYLVTRESNGSYFLGCHRYPECSYTAPYRKKGS